MIEVPDHRPTSPVTTVGPVLVTVEAPRTSGGCRGCGYGTVSRPSAEPGLGGLRAEPLLRGSFRKRVDYSNLNDRPSGRDSGSLRAAAPGNSHCAPTLSNSHGTSSPTLGVGRAQSDHDCGAGGATPSTSTVALFTQILRRCAEPKLSARTPVVRGDGDLETAVVFDVQDFVRVAEVMRPRKRRPAPAWHLRRPVSHWP